jgi:2-amino-4-hydroxy-6-hydroxymethyldihydropteridine diphosphokinase
MKVDAYIAVGSNIRPAEHVPAALALLLEAVDVAGVSAFYRVRPLDRPRQPDYRNGAIRVETDCDPATLHNEVLRNIEAEIGRQRVEDPHAARSIDLDLVLYGDAAYREGGLVLPDPDILKRNFLAVPLAELAPDAVVEADGRSLREIATELGQAGLTVDRVLTQTLKEMIAHEHESR